MRLFFFLFLPFIYQASAFGQSVGAKPVKSDLVFLYANFNSTRNSPTYGITGSITPSYVIPSRINTPSIDLGIGIRLIEMDRIYINVSSIKKCDTLFSSFNQYLDLDYFEISAINRLFIYKNLYLDYGVSFMTLTRASQYNQFGAIDLLNEEAMNTTSNRQVFGIGILVPLISKISLALDYKNFRMLSSLEKDPNQNFLINSDAFNIALHYSF